MFSNPKSHRTSQCEAPYTVAVQYREQTCHPPTKRMSDPVNRASQVDLHTPCVVMDHIVQHRIDTGLVVRSAEAGMYRNDQSSRQRQREKILKTAGGAGAMQKDQWFAAARLEHFDANSIDRDSALGKSRHFRSSLLGCDLERRRCELPDARNHLFGE